ASGPQPGRTPPRQPPGRAPPNRLIFQLHDHSSFFVSFRRRERPPPVDRQTRSFSPREKVARCAPDEGRWIHREYSRGSDWPSPVSLEDRQSRSMRGFFSAPPYFGLRAQAHAAERRDERVPRSLSVVIP